MAEILRLQFAWGVTADRIARGSYWCEQREQRKNSFCFTRDNDRRGFVGKQRTVDESLGGKKQTMNTESVGGGVKIETDETKKVHRYVHGDRRMPNCVLNSKHRLVDCRVNNNNNSQYDITIFNIVGEGKNQ